MKRLTRGDLASRLGPRPPSDAFWRRAIDRGEAALGAAPEAVDGDDRPDPLTSGDIVDVGDHAFVVVDIDPTDAGGLTYRIELVTKRSED